MPLFSQSLEQHYLEQPYSGNSEQWVAHPIGDEHWPTLRLYIVGGSRNGYHLFDVQLSLLFRSI